MRSRTHGVLAVASAAGLWALASPAAAFGQGLILDDDDDDSPAVTASAQAEPGASLGIGLRVRQIFMPKAMIELFVEEMPGTTSQTGFGLEFIREKGNFAFVLGVEYESLAAAEGLWLDKGDSLDRGDEPDLVEFEDFGWVGVDATFLWQSRLTSWFALRYGAGIGIGYFLGEVLRSDRACPDGELDLAQCGPSPAPSMADRTPEDDIPPVFPIINVVLGAQFRPIENIAINIEGGLRTVPFVGTSVAYMF